MNLVKNPSFTSYQPSGPTYLFTDLDNLLGACPWTTAVMTNPNETQIIDYHPGSTPNVFHQSISYASNAVPNNFAGQSGDEVPNSACDLDDVYLMGENYNTVQAYAGLYGYATAFLNTQGQVITYSNYREYIQQKMAEPAHSGQNLHSFSSCKISYKQQPGCTAKYHVFSADARRLVSHKFLYPVNGKWESSSHARYYR